MGVSAPSSYSTVFHALKENHALTRPDSRELVQPLTFVSALAPVIRSIAGVFSVVLVTDDHNKNL